MAPVEIGRIKIDVFRAPVKRAVITSFGSIPSIGIAILRMEDTDGNIRWRDIWGNFPTVTTEYRASLAAFLLSDLLLGKSVDDVSVVLCSLL